VIGAIAASPAKRHATPVISPHWPSWRLSLAAALACRCCGSTGSLLNQLLAARRQRAPLRVTAGGKQPMCHALAAGGAGVSSLLRRVARAAGPCPGQNPANRRRSRPGGGCRPGPCTLESLGTKREISGPTTLCSTDAAGGVCWPRSSLKIPGGIRCGPGGIGVCNGGKPALPRETINLASAGGRPMPDSAQWRALRPHSSRARGDWRVGPCRANRTRVIRSRQTATPAPTPCGFTVENRAGGLTDGSSRWPA